MGNNDTKGSQSDYSDLDPKKNYCLICPHCNSDNLEIDYIEYDKDLNDYLCIYYCQYIYSKNYEICLIDLLKESEEKKIW